MSPRADVRKVHSIHVVSLKQYYLVQGRVDGLYIVLISLHGLIRGQHMELGRDADTGGQASATCRLSPTKGSMLRPDLVSSPPMIYFPSSQSALLCLT